MEPWDLKAPRNPVQSRLKHPLYPSMATTSQCPQKPEGLGGFSNSQLLLGLGKKTPGPKPALGRAGRIKGGCSEELHSIIPEWMSDAAPEGAALGSLLSPGVLGRWQKAPMCTRHGGQEKPATPMASPFPGSSARG